ncbi:MAG: MerR family transcriptional regulator [Candidatus Competibacteraceae bacterium]
MATELSVDNGILPDTGLVPIRTVSSLTGVNPVTLRAWERRYGLIKPVRTPKGHRLYTMADVELINQVVALLEGGMSIGQVGQVLVTDNPDPRHPAAEAFDPWATYQHRLTEAIERFDENTLNAVYTEALSLYPIDIVTSHLIVPLLRELGRRWERAQGSVAEEHFFSVFLRNKLGARFHHHSRDLTGPCLLAACLPGEQHEIGILLFALAAADRDYRLILLGANTPLVELPPVVERANCQGIVLSGSATVAEPVIQEELPKLLRQLKVPVFIGGQVTARYGAALNSTGAITLGDDITLALRRVDSLLKSR